MFANSRLNGLCCGGGGVGGASSNGVVQVPFVPECVCMLGVRACVRECDLVNYNGNGLLSDNAISVVSGIRLRSAKIFRMRAYGRTRRSNHAHSR